MDPGLKENTIKLFVSFFWLTIEPSGLKILAPAPYLQLLKKTLSPALCSVSGILAWQTKKEF